jgi:hypothetical protein
MEVAGEVAEAWGHWLWNAEPLPRHAELWDQQFASNEQRYEALGNLRFKKDGYGNLMVHPAFDLTKVGNTTIFRTQAGVNGHWHLNGGAITLAEPFFKFATHYWYYNAKKKCRKKKHPWGSVDCRKSALQRWKTLGRPGHQSHEIDTSRPASNRPSAI